MAKTQEQITTDLQALLDSGVGAESKSFKFETGVSKLLGNPKHSISRKVPRAVDMDEVALICEALGETVLDVANKALSQILRTHYVSVEFSSIEAKEIAAIRRATSVMAEQESDSS